jgi:hypothetical protein
VKINRLRLMASAAVAAVLLVTSRTAIAQEQSLRFVGELDVPDQSVRVGGTTVGGLSGLTYDSTRDVYYVISDDRGEFGPARFYTLKIDVGQDGIRAVRFLDVTVLDSDANTPGIQPYAPGESDTEEILLLPDDSLLISSERDRNNIPWLRHFALDGTLLGDLPIPDTFMPDFSPGSDGQPVQRRGIRVNLGFEGLTLARDEDALYVMNEEALAQDGPLSTPAAGTTTRLLRYSFDGSYATPGRQYAYRTEKIFAPPLPADQFADNGVSALLWVRGVLPQYDFLDIERSFSTGQGFDVNVYGLRIDSAEDVTNVATLQAFGGHVIEKTLLVNMRAIGVHPDNLEGLEIGPRLPDGNRSLLLIADDNFSPDQTNQFLLFEILAPSANK